MTLLFASVAVACGGEEPTPAVSPTPVPTVAPSPTPDTSASMEIEFWGLDLSSTGQDLIAFLTDQEADCVQNELGADYARMLEAPLTGEAGALALLEEGGSDASPSPLPQCFTVERAASMSLSLFSAAADGFSAGTRDCMLQLLRDDPAIAEALGQGQAFGDSPAMLEVVACLTPEEASTLTPPGEDPPPDTVGLACLMQELEGTSSAGRILAVLSGADASGTGLTMEESAALGRAVEACGIDTDFSFPDSEGTGPSDDVAQSSDSLGVGGGSGQCTVGLILYPGDECSIGNFTMKIRDDGAAVLDGNIGGISMGNTVMGSQSISLNRFRASRSGSTWTIESLP